MAGHGGGSSSDSKSLSFPGVKAAVIWWLIGKFLAFDHRAEDPDPSTGQAIADLVYAPFDRATEHRVLDAVVGLYSEIGMFIKHYALLGIFIFLLLGVGMPILNKLWKKMMEMMEEKPSPPSVTPAGHQGGGHH